MGDRITKVTDNLYIGSAPIFSDDLTADLEIVQGLDVIVDLRGEAGKWDLGWFDLFEGAAPDYVRINFHDDGKRKNDFGLLDELDLDEGVLYHCNMGINRAPSAAFYHLLREGWTPLDAFKVIREKRPQAGIAYASDAFWHYLGTHDRLTARAGYAELFDAYIDQYWTPDQLQPIYDAIQENRQTEAAWYDDKGIAHVEATV